jgi:2-polyprenyl-6-methoxyphenol hydroxylase-like FAD-dependent oxidoreductase
VAVSADHAVVIGGSFAGLTAARVLSDHFDQVTIVERDEFSDELAPRRGVPQSPHVHGILKLGRDRLDELLPGFIKDTEQEGAVLFDQIHDGATFTVNGWLARGETEVKGFGVRRALLENIARKRVLAIDGVSTRRGSVNGLIIDQHLKRVGGVKFTESSSQDAQKSIQADLVVDAAGRASAAPKWLEEIGLTPPDETLINGFVGYASRWLKVPEEAWPGDMRTFAQLPMPSNTKGGILYRQDNGLHVMSLFGQSRDYPPSQEAAFMSFLSNCATPLMHEVVSQSEPVSGITTSRSTANRWRHYERLPSQPGGFVAVGDSAASFNPVLGQGITSACLGAMMLGDVFQELDGDLDLLPRAFQPRLASRLKYPWQTAVGFDLQFSETVGERPEPTAESADAAEYMGTIGQLVTKDSEVLAAMFMANQTFDSSGLYAPWIVERVKAWNKEGRRPRHMDPRRPPVRADAR